MALQKIAYGQNNWDKTINGNFEKTEAKSVAMQTQINTAEANLNKITNGSGWQKLSLIAPATGNLYFIIQNNVLYFKGIIVPHQKSYEAKAATLPNSIPSKSFVAKVFSVGEPIGARINAQHALVVQSFNAEYGVIFDGVAIYVGDISLGGGGRKPRLNHWFKGIYSHLEMEVA